MPATSHDAFGRDPRKSTSRARGSKRRTGSTSSLPASETEAEQWAAALAHSDSQMREAAARRPPGRPGSEDDEPAAWRKAKGRHRIDGSGDHDDRPGAGENDHPPQPPDIVQLLRQRHNEARALVEEIHALSRVEGGATPEDLHREQWTVALLVPMLAVHETAEQELFWPAVRDLVVGGRALAERAVRQERHAASILAHLDKSAVGTARFDDLVAQLASAIRAHVAMEDAVFLQVEDALSEVQRRYLGGRFLQIEPRGPTRARPAAPTGPAMLKLIRPVAAAVDKARDRTGGRARRRAKTEPTAGAPW